MTATVSPLPGRTFSGGESPLSVSSARRGPAEDSETDEELFRDMSERASEVAMDDFDDEAFEELVARELAEQKSSWEGVDGFHGDSKAPAVRSRLHELEAEAQAMASQAQARRLLSLAKETPDKLRTESYSFRVKPDRLGARQPGGPGTDLDIENRDGHSVHVWVPAHAAAGQEIGITVVRSLGSADVREVEQTINGAAWTKTQLCTHPDAQREPEPEPEPEPRLEPEPEPEMMRKPQRELEPGSEKDTEALELHKKAQEERRKRLDSEREAQSPAHKPDGTHSQSSADLAGPTLLDKSAVRTMARVLEVERRWGSNLSDEAIDAVFDQFDPTGSGLIAPADWDQMVTKLSPVGQVVDELFEAAETVVAAEEPAVAGDAQSEGAEVRVLRHRVEELEKSLHTVSAEKEEETAALRKEQQATQLKLDQMRGLAQAVFNRLDDDESELLEAEELDELVEKGLVADNAAAMVSLRQYIEESDGVVVEDFEEWWEDHPEDADTLFGKLAVEVRAAWAAKDQADNDDAAIALVEVGGVLAMYYESGKKKHDRFVWCSRENGGTISWFKSKTTKKPMFGNGPKTRKLVNIQTHPHTRTAREWFDAADTDKDGKLDGEQVASIYRQARGETLKGKQLATAMAQLDKDERGEIEFSEFEAWWKDNGGELEKVRDLALSVTCGDGTDASNDVKLLLVAHGVETKKLWVNGLEALLRLANRPQFTDEPNRDGASEDEDEEEEEEKEEEDDDDDDAEDSPIAVAEVAAPVRFKLPGDLNTMSPAAQDGLKESVLSQLPLGSVDRIELSAGSVIVAVYFNESSPAAKTSLAEKVVAGSLSVTLPSGEKLQAEPCPADPVVSQPTAPEQALVPEPTEETVAAAVHMTADLEVAAPSPAVSSPAAAPEHDSSPIVLNICSRKDLNYPTPDEVKRALEQATPKGDVRDAIAHLRKSAAQRKGRRPFNDQRAIAEQVAEEAVAGNQAAAETVAQTPLEGKAEVAAAGAKAAAVTKAATEAEGADIVRDTQGRARVLQWVNDSHGGTLSRAEYDRLSKEAFEEDPVDDEDWEDLLTTLKPANAPAPAAAAAAAAAGSGGTDGGGLQSQLTADQLVYGIENDELTFPSGDYEEILEAITALQVATAAADAKAQVEAKLEQERKQLQAEKEKLAAAAARVKQVESEAAEMQVKMAAMQRTMDSMNELRGILRAGAGAGAASHPSGLSSSSDDETNEEDLAAFTDSLSPAKLSDEVPAAS